MNFVVWVLIGAAAGWIAGKLLKGGGFGFIMNALLGMAGSVVGGWCFNFLNIQTAGLTGSLVTATVGAVVILWLANKLK